MDTILVIPKSLVVFLMLVAGVGLLMTPTLRYVMVGWKAKRSDILDSLGADARCEYFKMFAPTVGHNKISAFAAFEKLYSRWYGRRYFLIPGLLLFVVGSMVVGAIVFTGFHRFGYMANPVFDLPNTALAALVGAYLWVVHDHTYRVRRLDFAPSDPVWATLRFAVAVPLGYAFASVAAPSVGPFVAFALGAFPLSDILSMLRRLSEERLKLGAAADGATSDLTKLQGVNKSVLERLSNEDVVSVSQVAYCDPVRLVMRSNLPFMFVTDCASQALAWLYFEDKLAILRPFGMRGAVEIKNFVNAHKGVASSDADQACARAALPGIAAAMGLPQDVVLYVFQEIAGDPYTEFLSKVWEFTGEVEPAPQVQPFGRRDAEVRQPGPVAATGT